MKSITEQLDDHFGVDGWFKVRDVICEFDMVRAGVGAIEIELATTWIGMTASDKRWAYRANPNQSDNMLENGELRGPMAGRVGNEPEQSEKFWIVCLLGGRGGAGKPHETHLLAKEEAQRLTLKSGVDFAVFECIGIARAPKAVEYETL